MLINLLRGLLGVIVILAIAYFMSRDRKRINFVQVGKALLLQFVFCLIILFVPGVDAFFSIVGKGFVVMLNSASQGASFLFGDLVNTQKVGYIFAFQVFPVTLFFAALTSLLYYYGIIQWVINWIALGLRKVLNITGSEGLVSAGNIFLGQTEAPLLTKKHLPSMTQSETFLVMVSGMATVAGGVMAAYIIMLGNGDPVETAKFTKHLLTASVMAAPGAIALSKMLFPEKETPVEKVEIEKESLGGNFFEALFNGIAEGTKLVVNIAAMLLVIIAIVALINFFLRLIGDYSGLNHWIEAWSKGKSSALSLEFMMGLVLTPLTWLFGVDWADASTVGSLLGLKISLNEFVAYMKLDEWRDAGRFMQDKSIVMATYMLCGFANLSSIGIQIGGIGILAPGKRPFITQYGMLAMLTAALVSCLSGVFIGMLY